RGAAGGGVRSGDARAAPRLYTRGESTDWVYAVAWSPDGKQLAAAGVDRSIRVWQAGRREGKVLHSVFAHEGPVTRLAYAPDGKALYSLCADGGAKCWDAAELDESTSAPRHAERT